MARIVLISPYLKGGQNAAKLAQRTRYVATRPGVELLADERSTLPATKKQQDFIARLLKSFPSCWELIEYEEYLDHPTQGSASAFIQQVREDYMEALDQKENFIDYISHRPGVQKDGEHGLWDAHGKVQNLARAVREVAEHTGNVWTPVVALRREDAERLGYDSAENWRALVNASVCDIATAYKIQPDNLRWYAAFHQKPNQVHIHMILFSADPKEGLSHQGGHPAGEVRLRQTDLPRGSDAHLPAKGHRAAGVPGADPQGHGGMHRTTGAWLRWITRGWSSSPKNWRNVC